MCATSNKMRWDGAEDGASPLSLSRRSPVSTPRVRARAGLDLERCCRVRGRAIVEKPGSSLVELSESKMTMI